MASPSKLSLDMKPHSCSMLLKSFASSGDHQQLPEPKQLEDFLACLEDERLKIEAFKRELPLCMQLLSNAVETSRQKLNAVKSSSNQAGLRPELEEFIPLKSRPTSDAETDMDSAADKMTDKSNWMVSAQLWSQTSNTDNKQYDKAKDDHIGLDINSSTLTCIQKNPVRAFIPFSKDSISTFPKTLNKNEHHLLEAKKLLGSDNQLISEYYPNNTISISGGGMAANEPIRASAADCTLTTSNTTHNNNSNNTNNSSSNNNQPHRKARRCWSPDLHRKFVNALQMLGGSQVATPKQIRELMKVDGLTNDEVKSHLQKYRLHTRRPSPSPPTQHHHSPIGAPAAQLVVLGGIWVPPEYAAHHHTNAPALYHQPAVGPDHQFVHHHRQQQQQMYHIHHHHQQQQQQQMAQMQIEQQQPQQQVQMQMQAIQVYNKNNAPSSHSSPDQSDVRGISESIDDGKSESGSWKSGESAERMKGGGGDQQSEITLKF